MSSGTALRDDLGTPGLDRGLPRLGIGTIATLVLALTVVASLPALRGAGRDLDYGANLLRFLGRFLPPDPAALGPALRALLETCQIAVLATLAAALLALPLGLLASPSLVPRPVAAAMRVVLNAVRTLPSLVWALLAVAVVGATPRAGVVALACYSLGYLGKFFADAFAAVDLAVARTLRAGGAGRIQAFQHGVLPEVRPVLLGHVLWMLEYNVRAASIIGYVGAGGIGLLLHAYQEFGAWGSFATVLLVLFAVVTLLDLVGDRLRAALLDEAGVAGNRS